MGHEQRRHVHERQVDARRVAQDARVRRARGTRSFLSLLSRILAQRLRISRVARRYGVEKAFGFMSYDQGFLESYYRGPAYTEPPKKEGDKPKNKPGKPLWDTCDRRPPR